MATASVNGTDIYYERTGDGPPMVMTHGAWTDGRTWQGLIESLSARFDLVVWDRRGHSRSAPDSGEGSVREDAADLAALVEFLGLGPVYAVGNSAGGTVVLNFVTMRPDLLTHAAVHEPGPFSILEGTDDEQFEELMAADREHLSKIESLIRNGLTEEAARFFMDEVALGPGAWDSFPSELRQIVSSNAPTAIDDLRDAWDPAAVDIEGLAAGDTPLLISAGSDSPQLESAAARELSRRLPKAQLTVMDGAGHVPHRTHPNEYIQMLVEFAER